MYKRQFIQTKKMEITKCSGQRIKWDNQTVWKFKKGGYKKKAGWLAVARCSLPPCHCGALCQGLSSLTGRCLASPIVRWTATPFPLPPLLVLFGWLNHVATRNTLHCWLIQGNLFVHFSSLFMLECAHCWCRCSSMPAGSQTSVMEKTQHQLINNSYNYY